MSRIDYIFITVIILSGAYGYFRGLIWMLRPVVSLIGAKIACPVISLAVRTHVEKMVGDVISAKTAGTIWQEIPMAGNLTVPLTDIISFLIAFLLLNLLVSFIYLLIKPKCKITKSINAVAGAIVGIAVAVFGLCIAYQLSGYLQVLDIAIAKDFYNGVNESFIALHIIKLFSTVNWDRVQLFNSDR